jgi:hypothetical protein
MCFTSVEDATRRSRMNWKDSKESGSERSESDVKR